jgi:hypothetical protein
MMVHIIFLSKNPQVVQKNIFFLKTQIGPNNLFFLKTPNGAIHNFSKNPELG